MANIIIGTGGTGGHIFPARCLASELSDRNHQVIIFADKNYIKYAKSADNFKFKIISCSKLEKSLPKLLVASFKISYGFLQTLFNFLLYKPQVIVAFGGYATFGVLMGAVILRRKIILHEQNAHLGKVNKIFACFADKIVLSFKETYGIKPQFLNKTIFIGNPVRQEIAELFTHDYNIASLEENFNILIIGGSGGAKIFSEVLPKAISYLDEDLKKHLQITQQCKIEYLKETNRQYENYKVKAELSGFFTDMKQKIKAAHLIIARAGSSSIAEFCAAKKPMILIPFALSADNHQQKNADFLEKQSAAIIIKESEFRVDKVSNIIKDLIHNPKKLLEMSENAAKIANLKAAEKLADIILLSLK
jgi:UDP-N-acetylglucosamine--N-acetylmuramyl-(pentapeptide) pyrophosphoryl-undecaprenol N-acetylglucosamine transferase